MYVNCTIQYLTDLGRITILRSRYVYFAKKYWHDYPDPDDEVTPLPNAIYFMYFTLKTIRHIISED